MKIRFFFVLTIFMLIYGAGSSFATSLAEIETKIDNSDDSQILEADILREAFINEKAKAESGLKIFGSTGYSWNREPESLTSGSMIYYEKLFGRIGVTIPVLGSKWQEQAGIIKGERNILERRHDIEIYKKTIKTTLRKEYIDMWSAGRKIEILESFTRDEKRIKSHLKERVTPGFLLEADFQEFMTPFGRAKREIANCKMIIQKGTDKIKSVTDIKIDTHNINEPDLPIPETDETMIEKYICSFNPELKILEEIVSKNGEISNKTDWSGFESSIDLAYAPSKDFPGEIGQGASISLNVKAPLDFAGSNRATLKIAELERKKSLYYFNKRKAQAMNEFREFLGVYRVSLENLSFADQRLSAASEWMREARLRLKTLPGDVFEKFLQARYNYLGIALDAIDAEANCFKACADLLMIAEKKENNLREFTLDKLPGNSLKKRLISTNALSEIESNDSKSGQANYSYGVYLWDSESIINSPSTKAFWESIKKNHIGRILISFNNEQVRKIKNGILDVNITEFIKNARQRGVSPELLLGEPTWILPDHRADLKEIIHMFEKFDFSSVNIDLEPDQLKTPDTRNKNKMTGYLVDTIREISKVSRFKIGISVHPRYFDEAVTGLCLGCELEKSGINEAIIMIYSSDIARVSEKAQKIFKAYPLLRFSIAQSIEKNLPVTESHRSKSIKSFEKDMKTLHDSITPGNFNTVIIQSWKDLNDSNKAANYEN